MIVSIHIVFLCYFLGGKEKDVWKFLMTKSLKRNPDTAQDHQKIEIDRQFGRNTDRGRDLKTKIGIDHDHVIVRSGDHDHEVEIDINIIRRVTDNDHDQEIDIAIEGDRDREIINIREIDRGRAIIIGIGDNVLKRLNKLITFLHN